MPMKIKNMLNYCQELLLYAMAYSQYDKEYYSNLFSFSTTSGHWCRVVGILLQLVYTNSKFHPSAGGVTS